MPKYTANELAARLELARHPEGGWYRECYRSPEIVAAEGLPERFGASRSMSTSIYFLLERGDISCLHRIKSDELWHFYSGAGLSVHVIAASGEYRCLRLGSDLDAGESFQEMVPAGCWFGAEVSGEGEGEYTLVGCTVSPGFDFADFEMGGREELLERYPQHAEVIRRITRDAGAR